MGAVAVGARAGLWELPGAGQFSHKEGIGSELSKFT